MQGARVWSLVGGTKISHAAWCGQKKKISSKNGIIALLFSYYPLVQTPSQMRLAKLERLGNWSMQLVCERAGWNSAPTLSGVLPFKLFSFETFQCHFKELLFWSFAIMTELASLVFRVVGEGTLGSPALLMVLHFALFPTLLCLELALPLPFRHCYLWKYVCAQGPTWLCSKQGDSWLNGVFPQCLNLSKALEGWATNKK